MRVTEFFFGAKVQDIEKARPVDGDVGDGVSHTIITMTTVVLGKTEAPTETARLIPRDPYHSRSRCGNYYCTNYPAYFCAGVTTAAMIGVAVLLGCRLTGVIE